MEHGVHSAFITNDIKFSPLGDGGNEPTVAQHSTLPLVDNDGDNRHLARPMQPFHGSGASLASRLLNFPSPANPRNHSHDIRPFLRHHTSPFFIRCCRPRYEIRALHNDRRALSVGDRTKCVASLAAL